MGAIAEYDKKMTLAKLRAARQRIRTKTGRCEGRKPFGVHEGENAAIARILELHAQGKNYTDITNIIMNQEEHATRVGRRWYVTSVSRVLKRVGAGLGNHSTAGKLRSSDSHSA
jgi:hypothetical protein